MKYVDVVCNGASITVPDWLAPLMPREISYDHMPSFCGAGSALGDAIVPEHIHGVCLSLECFVHDCEWATIPDTIRHFLGSNYRFARNCRARILVSGLPWWKKEMAVVRAYALWFGAVSTIGALCFDPLGSSFGDPLDNPVVREKLHRLALANLGINSEKEQTK